MYDLGGGTFDISILEIGDGVFEVKSTNGDTFLGGEDFDQRIIDYLAEEFKKEHGIDLRGDKLALQRLKDAAEKAKIELSSAKETEINLPFITADASGPKHLVMRLTRAKLEALVDDLVQKTLEPCRQALKDAGIAAHEVDEVILVGGMTRMPKIIETVKQFFGKEPARNVNPDEVVAIGAAIQAGVLKGEVKDVLLLDVTPLSLGIETLGGVFTRLIERNTTIPTKKSQIFSTAEEQSDGGDHQSVPGRARDGGGQQAAWPVRPGRHPAGAARRAADRGDLRHRRHVGISVSVSARKDKATGKEAGRSGIQAKSGLSEADIERMIREAEANAEADRQRATVEARNALDMPSSTLHRGSRSPNGAKKGGRRPAVKWRGQDAALEAARSARADQSADAAAKPAPGGRAARAQAAMRARRGGLPAAAVRPRRRAASSGGPGERGGGRRVRGSGPQQEEALLRANGCAARSTPTRARARRRTGRG